MQELELKMQGGLMHEGGGVITGFYGTCITFHVIECCKGHSIVESSLDAGLLSLHELSMDKRQLSL